jgi:hypothetical protein
MLTAQAYRDRAAECASFAAKASDAMVSSKFTKMSVEWEALEKSVYLMQAWGDRFILDQTRPERPKEALPF